MRRALVIGGTGFIGLNLVDALLDDGVQVRVTRRRRSITAYVRNRPVELVHGDLDDVASLRTAMRGCDTVFMAAGHYPRYSLDLAASLQTGVRRIRNACDAALAEGIPRFVFTSSIAALDTSPGGQPVGPDAIPRTMPEGSVYRAVKWALEREVEAAIARGLPAVTILPGGCIGPWDVRLGTGGILVGVAAGAMPWWVDGFVHLVDVRDVALAHVRAAHLVLDGSRISVAGSGVRVGVLLRHIVARWGGQMPPVELDPAAARARADREEWEAAPRHARVPLPRELVDMATTGGPVSSASAERDLGIWLTPLDESLEAARKWLTRYHYLPAPTAAPRRAS